MTAKPPAKSRRRRRLSPEDQAIWDRVVQSVSPLSAARERRVRFPEGAEPDASASPSEPLHQTTGEPRRETIEDIHPRLIPRDDPLRRARSTKPQIVRADRQPGPVGRPEPGLDTRTADRLRRGDRAPDSRIDLHGMTADRAHPGLDRFIGQALSRGDRCVLVITGKGSVRGGAEDAPFMRTERGVLRQAAPEWLRAGPHAHEIVGIYAAHARHGGAGAFYVYLKRRR